MGGFLPIAAAATTLSAGSPGTFLTAGQPERFPALRRRRGESGTAIVDVPPRPEEPDLAPGPPLNGTKRPVSWRLSQATEGNCPEATSPNAGARACRSRRSNTIFLNAFSNAQSAIRLAVCLRMNGRSATIIRATVCRAY